MIQKRAWARERGCLRERRRGTSHGSAPRPRGVRGAHACRRCHEVLRQVLEALLTKGGGPSEGVRPIDGPSAGIAAIRCTLSSNGEEPDGESGDGPALVAHRVEWAAAHTTFFCDWNLDPRRAAGGVHLAERSWRSRWSALRWGIDLEVQYYAREILRISLNFMMCVLCEQCGLSHLIEYARAYMEQAWLRDGLQARACAPAP